MTGKGELIWDVVNRKVKLEEIPESDLPVMMQKMSALERTAFISRAVHEAKGTADPGRQLDDSTRSPHQEGNGSSRPDGP